MGRLSCWACFEPEVAFSCDECGELFCFYHATEDEDGIVECRGCATKRMSREGDWLGEGDWLDGNES